MSERRRARRALAVVVTSALFATLGGVLLPTAVSAAGTLLFENAFNNRTVDGTGTVTLPTPPSGTNVACLTAKGNSATLPLLSCAAAPDAQGSGKLRLTNSSANQVGGVFGQTSFPTSSGLDITFTSYQWGGGGADGIAFMLAAIDPTNPAAPAFIGPSGGSLGYTPAGSVKGLTNAYLGVGLDVFGNFGTNSFSGSGCGTLPNGSVKAPGSVMVRGPGNGLAGYCGLTTTYNGTVASKVTLRAATREASAVPVQVLINPTGTAFTSNSGVTVDAGTYKVVFTPVGETTRTLTGPLPSVGAGLYPSPTWLNANGSPKQLAFGFVGSTGSVTDAHEISTVKALTFNPVPQLAVSSVGYSQPTSVAGGPVTYRIASSVLPGADENNPISITQTVPVGVVVAGAYGTGWGCQPPVDRVVTCTTTGSSFANGTALPELTVVAIVTGSGVTPAVIQSSSTTLMSSADANPGADSITTAGTVPTAPTGMSISPTVGSISGGGLVTISASSNNLPATAIEIGTAAEQQAGNPVVLLPCPGERAAGCFHIEGSNYVILSMPPRASAATVTVTMVTNGVSSATSYVYASPTAAPATPTATAGITSATVNWIAPGDNGSVITGYVVTPYRNGVAQTAVSYNASTTTRTLTGLTAAASYTFTVSAVNAYGTSPASAKSVAVVPYTLPGAPVITATTAGSQSAVLTWTPPFNGGSVITGYQVTPYIGTVAQPTQTFDASTSTRSVTGLTAGTAYTFTVAAQNLAGTGPPSARSASVTPNVSPSLTFPPPPAGEVGVPYSSQLTVTDGTSPFVWSVNPGPLPGGLTLAPATGLLSGTPTDPGTFPFTVQVADASGQIATRAVSLVIAAAPALAFAPAAGEVGVAYTDQPILTGGTGPFAWRITAGSLPPGVVLNASTGLLSGTPTQAGNYTLTISVTDSFNQAVNRTATLVVVAAPAFTVAVPPAGQVGIAYSFTFAVTGGTLPLSWSVTAGSLPAGLVLDTTTGALSGIPTTVGNSPFTVSVADVHNQTAAKPVAVVITAGPLVINKTADVSSAAPGVVVSYTITVQNTSASAFAGVALSDALSGVTDDATYDADATATAGTLSYNASILSWSGNIPAGGSVTIAYSVTVNSPDAGNKVLSNIVTSPTLGTNCGNGSADTRCSVTVTVPGLSIVNTADQATTTPGGTVRFTIVVTNTGQFTYPAATLTDGLAGIQDDARYNADATSTSGSVSYVNPSLSWTGTLAPGASATITFTATVADPDTGDRTLVGTVVSPSAGSPCPSVNPAAQCTSTVPVLVPALSIIHAANSSTTTAGEVVTYTVTLANTGQTAYTGTTVALSLARVVDDASYNGDATATAGVVAFNAGTSTLVWTGDLATGAQAVVTASVTVLDPDPGDTLLISVASSQATGSTCPPTSSVPACTRTVQVLLPAMTITVTADAVTAIPGSEIHYTVSVTNNGQTPYAGAGLGVALTGVLDDATYRNDATADSGTVTYADSTVSWTGDLAIGATSRITYSVTVNTPDNGDRTLRAVAVSATRGANCAPGGTDPRCTSSVTVLLPGLSMSLTADSPTTTPNSVVRYALSVTNNGQTSYSSVTVKLDITGVLDDAVYNFDSSVTSGALFMRPDNSVDWIGSLAPGESMTGSSSFTTKDPATGDRSIQAIVISDVPGSTCPTGSGVAGCRPTVTVLIPGLTIVKTADTTTTVPGGTVRYTILVTNNGESAYAAAGFSDELAVVLHDAGYNADATATTGSLAYTGTMLSWTGSLLPTASATITYTVTVLDPDPGDKQLSNTVTSANAGNNCTTTSTDARCSATVLVLVPGLTLTKTADSVTTVPGAVITFTVTATNSGATPLTAATFSDSLAGTLDDADYNSDATSTSGTVGYAAPNLNWTGNLALGATATMTYTVTVHAADGGNNLVTNAITASSPSGNCVAGSDPRCTVTVPVARLILAHSTTSPTSTPGGIVTFAATYTNTGQVPYIGIVVNTSAPDAVDDGLPSGDQTATSGTLVLGAAGMIWTGDIPVGGMITLGATMVVANPDTGDKIITATLDSTAPGNNCPVGSTDPRCELLVTVLVPGLTITQTADTMSAAPGATVGYTITVTNSGGTAHLGASVTNTLTGVLDDASYNGDATTTSGTVDYTASALTWSGDLPVGVTATITYTVTVTEPATGDRLMVSPVVSDDPGSTCLPANVDTTCRSIVAVLLVAPTIEKTAEVDHATLGTPVEYMIVVTNSGQVAQDASFSDPLTGVLDDATYDGDAAATSGTVEYNSDTLAWSGTLAPGASATVTYTVTIGNPAVGDRVLLNTVVSTTKGNNCTDGSTDIRCTTSVTVTDATTLTFTKTADVAATEAGAVVGYTVLVANAELAPMAAEFTDPLIDILDDADFNNDIVVTGGSALYTEPDVTWTGTVPASGSVTVTYTVTVHSTPIGDELLTGTVRSASFPGSDNCLAGSTDPRCTNSVPVAALVLEQHFTEASTTPGSVVHQVATFTNTGQFPYTAITVTNPAGDVLDDATPNGDQTASSGSLVLGPTSLSWTGDIAIGGQVTISGSLTVRNPDPGDQLLTTTASTTAVGSNCPAGDADPRCTAQIAVLLPGLTISKVADKTVVDPGGGIGYTVTLHNTGETPYTGTTVTDSMSGVNDDATYNGDATTSAGTLSYVDPILTWTGDLAVGSTVTIFYTMTVLDPATTGDKTMVNVVTSDAVGSDCPTASPNPACRSIVLALTPILVMTSAASPPTTAPGAAVVYTVTATNMGQTAYPMAKLSVNLAGTVDDATYNGDATASTGSVTVTGPTLSWQGPLPLGASVTITYSVTVNSLVTGDFRLTQAVVSTEQGSTCPVAGTDPRCATSVPIAALRIVNSTNVAVTEPGAVVRNTVVVTNVGQVPYLGISITDSFVGSLDDATYNGDATASTGSLVLLTGTGRIVWTGDLAVGAQLTVTGSLTVHNPGTGDRMMTTLVSTDTVGGNCPIGGTDPACATSVPVLIPGLTISKSADTTTTSPGGTVRYTITVTDSGQTGYTAAVVTDSLASVLNDAAYNGDAQASSGTVGIADATLTWTGDLTVGQVVVISYSVQVHDPDLGDHVVVNGVRSDNVGSTCPTGETGAGCVTQVIVLVPVLDIAVTADRVTAVPGDTVAYTVTVHNAGRTPYSSANATIALTGVLDDATYAADATATTGTVAFEAPNLAWTGELAVGATAVIGYSVTVDSPDEGDLRLVTSISSTTSGTTCTPAAQCANTVTVLVPGLAVTMTADVATTTPGGQVNFTITVANTGETPYLGTVGTVLTDVLDDATFDGVVTASIGLPSYTSPNLSWTGSLPAGGSATIGFRVTVADPDPGDRTLTSTVLAAAPGSTCQAGVSHPACTVTVTVLVPGLTISKSADSATTTPGGVVSYTIVVANTGQTAYRAAAVTDSLGGILSDADYNDDAQVVGGGTLTMSNWVLTWTGDLLVGASATITYSITVHDPDTGDKLLTNTVASTTPGSTCAPAATAPECWTMVRVLVPALVLTKTANTAVVSAGSSVQYTVTVTNTGQTAFIPASFTDPLTDVLDDADYDNNAATNLGTVEYSNGTLVWTGPLAIGATATITYTATTHYPPTGDRTLINSALSASQGANCTTALDPLCTASVAVVSPALTIIKIAGASEVVAGDSLEYTISATNTGESDYPATTISDSLSGVLDDAAYNGDATASVGTLSYMDATLSWTGPLPIGGTVLITYSVTAALTADGDGTLVNRVVNTAPGSSCVANGVDPNCTTSTLVADRTITLTGLTPSFTLAGPPDSTVASDGTVTMTVTTNNSTGYLVTVQAATGVLTGVSAANDTSILIGQLAVRPSGTEPFLPLSATVPVLVHQQGGPSAPEGDAVSNDYQVRIPFVPADTYTTTLDYIVSAQ